MNVIDFLPSYKNINEIEQLDIFPEQTFEESIYKKREFYENILPRIENIKTGAGEYYNHQKNLSRILSGNTPYDEMLLFHSMGTGKTCTSVAIIEENIKTGYYKRVFIVAPNKTLLNNYIDELVFVCTKNKYNVSKYSKIKDRSERTRLIKSDLKNLYSFDTYGSLYKRIESSKNKTIRITDKNSLELVYKNVIQEFSNSIIILDEIQKLRPKSKGNKEDNKKYKEILMMCRLSKNRKIIAMSGTPMKDGPEEISSIMNILLPQNLAFPDKEEVFLTEYFNVDPKDGDNKIIKKEKIPELKQKFRGRVSILQSMDTGIKKNFIINNKFDNSDNGKYIKFYKTLMSDFQTRTYINAFKEDSNGKGISGFYDNSRQTSLFAYPNKNLDFDKPGLYGSEGYNTWIKESKNPSGKYYILKDELSNIIKPYVNTPINEILEVISYFSSIYGDAIHKLIENKNKCTYIYSESVKGCGAILFSKLLELIGYEKTTGKETTKKLRYAILTSETSTPNYTLDVMKMMSSKDNINGEYLHVIIGSDTTTEGFNLYNIQMELIFTPFWNYTTIDQALARGIRVGSHRYLIENGMKPEVDIYQYTSIPYNNSIESIFSRMYKISEVKDISIKNIQRIMKESAIDCALNYKRNLGVINNSRECEYKKCDFKCDGIDMNILDKELSIDELDNKNFNVYYSNSIIDIVIKKLENLFNHSFYTSIDVLKNIFPEYTEFEIVSSLQKIITENITIRDKFGVNCYLKEKKGIYFLSTKMIEKDNILSVHYTELPAISIIKNINEEMDVIYGDTVSKYIEDIYSNKINKSSQINKIFDILTIELKEYFIETIILQKVRNINYNKSLDNIIKNNEELIYLKDNEWISEFLYKNGIGKIRKLDKNLLKWIDYDDIDIEKIKENKLYKMLDILFGKIDGISIYGIIKDKQLSIVQKYENGTNVNDARKFPSSSVCGTGFISVSNFYNILLEKNYNLFDLPHISVNETKEEYKSKLLNIVNKIIIEKYLIINSDSICKFMGEKLKEKNLIFDQETHLYIKENIKMKEYEIIESRYRRELKTGKIDDGLNNFQRKLVEIIDEWNEKKI